MSARSDAVPVAILNLGKKLVAELGLEDSVDTLGRWMAHYVAELISDVEPASLSERPVKEARCAAAILELWRHRHDAPGGRQRFEPEPLLRAIASLDPESPGYRYFAHLRESAKGDDDAVQSWLRLADGIDTTARMLVVQCLVAAAAQARDRSRDWIAMADAAGIEDDPPAAALRFVNEQQALLEDVEPNEANREKLTQRLKRLKAFIQLAKMLKNQLTRQLGTVADLENKSDTPGKLAKRDKPGKQGKPRKSRAQRKSPKRGTKRNTS